MKRAALMIDPMELISSAETMEALPITVGRLATLVSDPDRDMRDIVEVVSLDQALTADLLRRANSAASAPTSQVRTVRDAVMRMGTSSLLSMALAATVSTQMNKPLPGYGLAEGALWKESVAASLAAEVVAVRASAQVPAEAGTAALLHDFGKVVLSQHLGPQMLDLLSQAAANDGMDILQAELTVLGINHAEIGGLVAQQWKLPATIIDAIVHHHEVSRHHSPTSAAVALAHGMVPEILAAADGIELDASHLSPAQSHADVMSVLGIATSRYPDLLAVAQQRYLDLADRYGV